MPTRYNEIGLAGRKAGAVDNAQQSAGVSSDPFLSMRVIELPLVASAAEQDTGFTMPANCFIMGGFLRVRVASTGGAAQTIDIGQFGGTANSIMAAGVLSAIANIPTDVGVDIGGDNIGYTFAGADITGFEGELVLTVLASDT